MLPGGGGGVYFFIFFHFVCICCLLLIYLYIPCTSLHEYMQAGDLKQTHGRLWSVNVQLRREMSIAASACQRSAASAESFHSSNRLFTRHFRSRSEKKMIYFYKIWPRSGCCRRERVWLSQVLNLIRFITEFSRNIYKPCLCRRMA